MALITAEAFDSDDARSLSVRYYGELAARLPDFRPDMQFNARPEELKGPRGTFLVARVDGEAVGCGGLRALDNETGEIKHMWVAPELRGRGLGRQLLSALEDAARQIGFHRLVLDTSAHLPEAVALYSRAGFSEIAPYNENRHAQHWFERSLETNSGEGRRG